MRTTSFAASVLVFLLLFTTFVHAEDPFSEGKRLFDSGDYAAAAVVLQQAFREQPENLDASFYLGRAAYEAGDYETAAMAFERILITDPTANRVKLELARSYVKLGSRDIAREYFKSVQATNPPPAVWQQIQRFIDTIDDAERKHLINGFVTLGIQYDDNVGTTPALNIIFLDALQINAALDQKVEKDSALQATAVFNHIYRFIDTPYVWKSTLTSYNNLYREQSDFDLNYFALNSGIVRQNETSLTELQGMVGQIELGRDRYLDLYGATLGHTRFLSRTIQLNLDLSAQNKSYQTDSNRDAFNWSLAINPVLALNENRFSMKISQEYEDTKLKRFDYQRKAVNFRYDRQLPMDYAVYAGFRYQKTEYDDIEPLFTKERADRQSTWDIGLSKTFWRSDDRKSLLTAQLSHTHTDNDSNIALYTYEKGVTLLSLTFAF